jgi:hypothetical protein
MIYLDCLLDISMHANPNVPQQNRNAASPVVCPNPHKARLERNPMMQRNVRKRYISV